MQKVWFELRGKIGYFSCVYNGNYKFYVKIKKKWKTLFLRERGYKDNWPGNNYFVFTKWDSSGARFALYVNAYLFLVFSCPK